MANIALLGALAAGLFGVPLLGQTAAKLALQGDIAAPLALTASDLAGLPRRIVTLAEHDGKVSYEGVAVRELLTKAGLPAGKELRGKALASYVVAKGHDGYQVVYAIAEFDTEFTDNVIIVADRKDGKPLADTQGPLRLVNPGDKRPARSVRMLESLEIVRLEK